MTDTYCRSCGTIFENDDSFCAHCGKPVPPAIPTPTTITPADAQRIAQAHRNTDGLAWLGLFVGAIVGFLAWLACIYVIHITGAEVTQGLSVAVTVGCIILGFVIMLKVMTLGDVE